MGPVVCLKGCSMTEDVEKKKKYSKEDENLFDEKLKMLNELKIKNQIERDSTIIKITSFGFPLSLSLPKLIINKNNYEYVYILYTSWFLFTACIILLILSFITAEIAIDKSIENSAKFYIKKEKLVHKNTFEKINNFINFFHPIFLILAIFFIVVFITINSK